ncbi:MAG: phosphoribosylformylglycinamidine synthase subunit PurS [Ignavibacteriales bacterium]
MRNCRVGDRAPTQMAAWQSHYVACFKAKMKEFIVKIEVKLKPIILDPQGKAVLTALHNLGYDEVQETRIGKLIELKVKDENAEKIKERVQEMCKKLLANPVIEDFVVKVD